MITIINLDVGRLSKPTKYGFNIKSSPLPVIYFRLYEGDYPINYDNFQQLTLRIQLEINRTIYTKYATEVVTIDDEKFVKFNVTADLLAKMDNLIITPTVKILNKTTILNELKVILYEGSTIGMSGILRAIDRFNHMYGMYLNAIKRDQLNKPYGVVGLDSTGRISITQLHSSITEHIHQTIRFHTVHGLRMNDDFMPEFYDNEADYWFLINQIHGGFLTISNKDEVNDIYGGNLDGTQIINASTFDVQVDDVISGGTLGDSLSNAVDAGTFMDAGIIETNPLLKPIHGGFL